MVFWDRACRGTHQGRLGYECGTSHNGSEQHKKDGSCSEIISPDVLGHGLRSDETDFCAQAAEFSSIQSAKGTPKYDFRMSACFWVLIAVSDLRRRTIFAFGNCGECPLGLPQAHGIFLYEVLEPIA